MRIVLALAALVLTGCLIEEPADDGYYGGGSGYGDGSGWGSGWGGGSGAYGLACYADSECVNGNVCTRNGECMPPSQVRSVQTTWTLRGVPASDASCARAPDLAITFTSGYGEQFGYSPVPCRAGKFTVDKLPTRFTGVQLARDADYGGGATAVFDSDGTAHLDLPY